MVIPCDPSFARAVYRPARVSWRLRNIPISWMRAEYRCACLRCACARWASVRCALNSHLRPANTSIIDAPFLVPDPSYTKYVC